MEAGNIVEYIDRKKSYAPLSWKLKTAVRPLRKLPEIIPFSKPLSHVLQ
jgi:hypothetical protein